ncbi:hypothetical protein TSUD_27360 [Trifolium subterraneum]|uniref:Uncharacterized protein n=1 Tax=Trifolium subterraneum TaxID=3900 RepID=A0A2Z6LXG9_TRISU|nr:hypothetical protein TSUD_27360 [Trifolium subterraneum]
MRVVLVGLLRTPNYWVFNEGASRWKTTDLEERFGGDTEWLVVWWSGEEWLVERWCAARWHGEGSVAPGAIVRQFRLAMTLWMKQIEMMEMMLKEVVKMTNHKALGLDDGFDVVLKPPPPSPPPPQMVDMEENYGSEELNSSDPDTSDNEKTPKYEKFRMEELTAKYKFKVGLEFSSL